MRILVVNDDGIDAKGIEILAREAARFGDVWVAAPDEQCSAMSHGITLRRDISVKESPFPLRASLAENFLAPRPVEEPYPSGGNSAGGYPAAGRPSGKIRAFRVGGTPADCVRVALGYLMPEKPDFVLSGINFGYNTGFDIAYSGTVAAAMEGLMNNVPAAAFSVDANGVYGTVEKYLHEILKEILEKEPVEGEIWNVNFPGCPPRDCRGILRDCKIAGTGLFIDTYKERREADGTVHLSLECSLTQDTGTDNDLAAVKSGYIAMGKIHSMVFWQEK